MSTKSAHIPTYLYRRNHKFYYRKRIPQHLSQYFDLSEIRFPLNVSSLSEAVQKAYTAQFKTEQLFEFIDLITNKARRVRPNQIPFLLYHFQQNIIFLRRFSEGALFA